MLGLTGTNLQWYRDIVPRGQEAADAVGAEQVMDGSWPVAVWPCSDPADAKQKWSRLYEEFGVNAMTYHYMANQQEYTDGPRGSRDKAAGGGHPRS